MKKVEPANFPQFEAEMLKVWDTEKTFEQSLKLREGAKRFRFYDGPPFTSGPPHYGHLEQSALKDAVVRYKTMRGYYVPRRTGADTHGLPIENLVEKEHGFATKKDILAFGIDKFNTACRAIVFRHKTDFDAMYHRMGRWTNPDETYATLDNDYIESVWRVFANLNDQGLIYQGFKSLPYCPRCATPLSNFEVNDGYKDDVPDPSVYVKFPLTTDPQTSLLAWTTTPWTLPANAALAVNATADYATVELLDDGDSWRKGERLILAKQRLSELDLRKAEYKIVSTQKGVEVAGLQYEPLFDLVTDFTPQEQTTVHRVYVDDSVSLEDGTGILHVAPRYGETDLVLGLRARLPLIESVNNFGLMTDRMGDFAGLFFKDADPKIIENLGQRGRLFAAETFTHTYPFCWRCETPLLYFAMPSWFVAVSKMRDNLVEAGQAVKWIPSHVKQGRFIKWLEGARDWAISRTRFWGAPIPVWVNEADPDDRIVVGSLAELRELSGHSGDFDLHRPGIDQITVQRNGKTYRRVEEVFDCWFESGSMPYGQEHYPFENKDEFEASFPADFVCEAIEQVHLWFYTLHVLAVAQFGKPAYKNVVATGIILGADGRKLSKRLRNYPPVEEVFDKHGADVLRFFILGSPLMSAGDTRLSEDGLQDIARNVFMTLWNVVVFFTTYAEIDQWQPNTKLVRPEPAHLLDRWMLARVDETVAAMTSAADDYHIAKAVEPLKELIDDLSNWYVRRSRRRFGKNQNEADKADAYQTLHYTLLIISQLLAPWAPFISDKMWRILTEGMGVSTSVHLSDWPVVGKEDEEALVTMLQARRIVTEGLAQRAEAGIKVRQPLAGVKFAVAGKLGHEALQIIADELNVKEVQGTNSGSSDPLVKLDLKVTPELAREGLMRDLVRQIQALRKEQGLNVNDRIRLEVVSQAAEVNRMLDEYAGTIQDETLAEAMKRELSDERDAKRVRLGGADVDLFLTKVS